MRAYERLLKYVRFGTASDESCAACPSTETQRTFGAELVREMTEMGLSDVRQDENGYVYARLPGNAPDREPIGFIAHMDTVSDAPVQPMKAHIIENYRGGDIVMDEEGKNILKSETFPSLNDHIGKDLIITDGNTLLGADDKAGIAEILTACEELLASPEIPRGDIMIAFTPDEEIGRGADRFDVAGFGAAYACTVDGGGWPVISYETFSAAAARIDIRGLSIHPGSAKGKMVNALLVANEAVSMLPPAEAPAHTSGYEGFYHLVHMSGQIENAFLAMIIRDHDRARFEARKAFVTRICAYLNDKYGEGTVTLTLRDSYYNMADIIEKNPAVLNRVKAAFRRMGLDAICEPTRGGTDGSRLSFMGLPCPNLPTGGYNCHGRFEYAVIQEMDDVVTLIKAIATEA